MKTFFSTDGPVMRAMTDVMNLLILNLVTLLCCVPLVTIGASLTAMHYVLMQMTEGEEGRIAATFFRQFRGNLKTATPPWLILAFFAAALYADQRILGGMEGAGRYLVVPIYIAAVVVFMLFVWILPLLARFENTLPATFRNAFILAMTYLPRTIGMAVLTAVIPFVLTQVTRLLPLAFFFGLSLPGYFCALLYRPVIKDLVEKAERKTTPPEGEA